MDQHRGRRAFVLMAGAAVIVLATTAGVNGQKPGGPADVAAKLSGTWKLNRGLSPSVGAPGGRTGGPGRGGASFAIAGAPGAFAPQRGGGGGGGLPPISSSADVPPDVLAAQAAMRELQQIAEVITVKATADSIGFADPRGEHTYGIDNKTAKLESKGATIDVKTRWDKLAVRQEFLTRRPG